LPPADPRDDLVDASHRGAEQLVGLLDHADDDGLRKRQASVDG